MKSLGSFRHWHWRGPKRKIVVADSLLFYGKAFLPLSQPP
jgi:hypothetical protein